MLPIATMKGNCHQLRDLARWISITDYEVSGLNYATERILPVYPGQR
jgi:hypothetical protein